MTLFERIEKRMADPKLNANFNREVSKECNVTSEDIRNYELAREAYLRHVKSRK